MKKNKFNKVREIFKIKNQIYKKMPYVNDIDIKIDKAENGQYESLIRLNLAPRKRLIAVKREKSISLALEKSKQAILRQLEKVRRKKVVNRQMINLSLLTN